MTILFNLIRFQALAAGLGNFGVGAADVGCVVPEIGYAINGKVYTYTARVGSQYEYGGGAYDTTTHTLARTTIYSSSNGNAKVNFTSAPMVDVYPSPQPLLEPSAVPIRPPQGHIFGYTLVNVGTSTSISIQAGECADSTGAVLLKQPGSLTKTTSGWAVGSNLGALDTGSIAANTWYHVFIIGKLVGVVLTTDALISTSLTPVMPTGYTLSRRIGSIRTNGSSQWSLFTQVGDDFIWFNAVTDFTGVLPNTATSYTLTAPLNVPIEVFFTGYFTSSAVSNDGAAVWSPYSNTATGPTNFQILNSNTADAKDFRLLTNTLLGTGHIRALYGGAAVSTFIIYTKGWKDTRGRLL